MKIPTFGIAVVWKHGQAKRKRGRHSLSSMQTRTGRCMLSPCKASKHHMQVIFPNPPFPSPVKENADLCGRGAKPPFYLYADLEYRTEPYVKEPV